MRKSQKIGLLATLLTTLVLPSIFGDKTESGVKYGSPSSPLTSWNTTNSNDLTELTNIVYVEAASQSETNRELVAKVIMNRVENPNYPGNINDVIHENNAFTCTFDGSPMWKQATGELPRNSYEEMVYQNCTEDAKEIMNGKTLGIERENDIIAYHDWSIEKPVDNFWKSLEPVYQNEKMIFYAPIESETKQISYEEEIQEEEIETSYIPSFKKDIRFSEHYIPKNNPLDNNILGFNPYKNNFPKEKPSLLARMRRIREEDYDIAV